MLPREKLQTHGVEEMTNEELLAIIFGTGYKRVPVVAYAQSLLATYRADGLAVVRSVDQLRSEGVPPVKAAQLVACFELGSRFFRPLPEKELHTPKQVYQHVRWMCDLSTEQTRLLLLDARARILHEETIALGSVNLHILMPKDVFRIALKYNALNTIIVHNHPSGEVSPSQADVEVTKALILGGAQVGIPLLDHLILGKRGYGSLREKHPLIFKPTH